MRDSSLSSIVAYTSGPVPEIKKGPDGYYAFFSNGGNWIDSRVRTQDVIFQEKQQEVRELSARIQSCLEQAGLNGPALVLLKGDTAAGKTSTIRNSTGLLNALNILDEDGNPSGVINPDEFKSPLRRVKTVDGTEQLLNHTQVLGEGGTLGSDFLRGMMVTSDAGTGTPLNLVIDKRFSRPGETEATVKEVVDRGYKTVVVLDIDAEYETSVERVSRRDPNGEDPVVPNAAIREGFVGSRENRKALIEFIDQNNEGNTGVEMIYFLYSTDQPGAKGATLISKISPQEREVPDGELFGQLQRV
jgi:hypothetical protein